MLNTTDLVKVADSTKKEQTKYFKTFTRPYLSFGTKDATVEEKSEFETVDNGKQVIVLTSPKEAKTTHEPTELFQQALQYFQSEQDTEFASKTAKGLKGYEDKDKVDPLLILLKHADNGLIASLRMQVRNDLVPKVIDVDKASLKMAEGLVQKGKFKDIDSALAAVKAMFA